MKLFISLSVLLAPVLFAKAEVSKDISFEDLLINGKYHFSDEAVVTVEDDKVLDALLGIRKDFKDRLEMSSSHY